jgi:hypothetical protein
LIVARPPSLDQARFLEITEQLTYAAGAHVVVSGLERPVRQGLTGVISELSKHGDMPAVDTELVDCGRYECVCLGVGLQTRPAALTKLGGQFSPMFGGEPVGEK